MFSNFLGNGAKSGHMGMIITLVIWVVIFYLFLIRPNKKKQKKHKEMVDSLQAGKEVVSIGGIKGEVVSVNNESVVVRVDKGVRLTFTKDAIRKVL